MKRTPTRTRQKIARQYHSRKTVKDIAKENGVSEAHVLQCAKEFPPKDKE